MQVLLANPRGFCAGVDRAIEIVERALSIHGAPVYVRHEIVHNRHVVEALRERGGPGRQPPSSINFCCRSMNSFVLSMPR